MEHIKNEFYIPTLAFAIFSLFTSILSILNLIPLMITYQLLYETKKKGVNQKQEQTILNIVEFAAVLTLCFTLLYFNIIL